MVLVDEDLQRYMTYLQEKYGDIYLFSSARTPNQYNSINYNENNISNWQIMRENLDIHNPEFVLCNLIEDDLAWIGKKVKNKSALFYASNIFKYYAVNMIYDYIKIKSQYNYLISQLKKSNDYIFLGTSYK